MNANKNSIIEPYIGCDPEFFIKNVKTGKYIAAHEAGIPGTKDNPVQLGYHNTIQVDGLAAEIGITPTMSSGAFVESVQDALDATKAIIPVDCDLDFSPTAFFEKEYYEKNIPESMKVLGCNPDRNAYKNGAFNTVPDVVFDPKRGYMRSAGGHIHIGWTHDMDVEHKEHIWDCILLTKNIDTMYNCFSSIWDDDKERVKMYGAPGCFRVKSYGMEYRTPSNAWLKNKNRMRLMFDTAKFAYYCTWRGRDLSLEKAFKSYEIYHNYGCAPLRYRVNSFDYYDTQINAPTLFISHLR